MKNSANTVLVLDAGGTNLVFSAVRVGNIQKEAFILPAKSENLNDLLQKIIYGFSEINRKTGEVASAISFSFPGPADFQNGIIGDLENLPFFRGGVPLKNILENKFKIPVFINNDGNLFALGEAISGLLPEINLKLKNQGVEKQYKNLLGVTLGTGFGGGIVINCRLLTGDNSAGAEINRMANPFNPEWTVEETLSIRGIKRLFAGETGIPFEEVPEPDMIFEIGDGNRQGFQKEAIAAWQKFGGVLGEALANAITLIDGLVVIGGGLSGAFPLFLPKAVETMNRKFQKPDGGTVTRMEIAACNLNDETGLKEFLTQEQLMISVPFCKEKVTYYPQKKTGVGITRLGTSRAVAVGAYAFAVKEMGLV